MMAGVIPNTVKHDDKVNCGIEQTESPPDWRSPCKMDFWCDPHQKYRTIDGSCNNLHRPQWGKADWPFDRLVPDAYEDRHWFPRSKQRDGHPLPNVRQVSQVIHGADSDSLELPDITNLHQAYGQFLDHDLTLTPMLKDSDGKKPACCEGFDDSVWDPDRYHGGICFPIHIQPNDRAFKRNCLDFGRSSTKPSCHGHHLEQINLNTAFLDLSQVYGSNMNSHAEVRSGVSGLLRSERHDLLPAGTSMCFLDGSAPYCFGSGDKRVNEHPGLSVFHTLVSREHNLFATQLSLINPHWNDERLFQETKKILSAQFQIITYREWLPILLGPKIMEFFKLDLKTPYQYNPHTNPTTANSFATSSFRYGHSQIPTKWTVGDTKVPLAAMFKRPLFLFKEMADGVNQVLAGMLWDHSQAVDERFSSGISDHLFEHPTTKPMDLVSLNIQRGRDHGLSGYSEYRSFCHHLLGAEPEIPEHLRAKLMHLYGSFEDIDLFTGSLLEEHLPDSLIGPTFACLIGLHFHKIKFGDRYWHQTHDDGLGFTKEQMHELHKTSFARLFCDTSDIKEFQREVFRVASDSNPRVPCSEIPAIDLRAWAEHSW